jgi:YVTN family beta-propeller protein
MKTIVLLVGLMSFTFLAIVNAQDKDKDKEIKKRPEIDRTLNNNTGVPLKLIISIPLPGVSGRIDHMAYNSKQQTIYVAALGNNTVEVVDLKSNKVIHSIKGLSEPQGIRYIPENNVVFIANGGNGECNVFNADSYQKISSVKLDGDADNVRYNPATKRVYVGYGDGAIAVIDATTFKQLADVKLPTHPESFQIMGNDKLFVNVPNTHLINVIDLKKNLIVATWKVEEASSNFPMALDTTNHRLFIGCRHPAKLLIIDTETGKTTTSLDIDSDTDDVFYDGPSKQIYVSCGSGSIDLIKQIDADNYKTVSKIETRSGARTSLYIPERNELIVAAPARSGKDAQLMIFSKR